MTAMLYKNGLENCENPSASTIVTRTVDSLGRLSCWRSSLPNSLQILSSKDLAKPKVSAILDLYSTRFRVFLSLRYLSSRILTYRAILHFFLKDMEPSDNCFEQNESPELLSFALLEGCADCCRLVIDIAKSVARLSEEGVNVNGAWWLSVHHGQCICESDGMIKN